MRREATVPKPAKLLDLMESEITPQPCWISPGVLPKGGTLLFGGPAKVGKSMLLLEMARALSTGTNPFGYNKIHVHQPVKVLYVEQEIGEYGLQERVLKVFGNEDKSVFGSKMWYVCKIPQMQLDTPVGREILYNLVEDVKPQVLILDPIGRMHAYDENKNDQIQELFSWLEELVKVHQGNNMSLILAHHFSKPSGDPNFGRDPLDPYNFRGASKFYDNPDSLITVSRLENLDTKGQYEAWKIKMRMILRHASPPPDLLLTINKENDLRVRFVNTLDKKTGQTSAQPKKEKVRPAEQLMLVR